MFDLKKTKNKKRNKKHERKQPPIDLGLTLGLLLVEWNFISLCGKVKLTLKRVTSGLMLGDVI